MKKHNTQMLRSLCEQEPNSFRLGAERISRPDESCFLSVKTKLYYV